MGISEVSLSLVKIDVEGAEAEVIGGLTNVLVEEQPLVCVEVLDEARWRTVRAQLEAAGYVAWYVIVPESDSRAFVARAWSALRGKRYRLVPLPPRFRAGGYDMILCATSSQAAKIGG